MRNMKQPHCWVVSRPKLVALLTIVLLVGGTGQSATAVDNQPPEASGLEMISPFVDCSAGQSISIARTTPTVSAIGTDPEGSKVKVEFSVRSGLDVVWTETTSPIVSGSGFSRRIPTGILSAGNSYQLWARASDGSLWSEISAGCTFTIDVTNPTEPVVSPVTTGVDGVYKRGSERGGVGLLGKFTLTSSSDAVSFLYGFNNSSMPSTVKASAGAATLSYTPTRWGPVTLSVAAIDGAGNVSPRTDYKFDVDTFFTPPAPTVTTPPTVVPKPSPTPGIVSPGVTRLQGPDRYGTSVAVSKALYPKGNAEAVYISSGANFPDALAAAPAARLAGAPILLTTPKRLSEVTEQEVKRLQPKKIVILGSTKAVSAAVQHRLGQISSAPIQRIGGANRYETAIAITRSTFPKGKVKGLFVVSGANFPDALSVSSIAAHKEWAILPVPKAGLTASLIKEIKRLDPEEIVIAGRTPAVSAAVAKQVTSAASSSKISRIGGKDRYETSALLSAAFFSKDTKTVVLSTGRNFPDALSVSQFGGVVRAPILIVQPHVLTDTIRRELVRMTPSGIVITGSPKAVSTAVERAAATNLGSESG